MRKPIAPKCLIAPIIGFLGWLLTLDTQAQLYQQTKAIGTLPIQEGRRMVQVDWDRDGHEDILLSTVRGEIYLQKAQKNGRYETFKLATGLSQEIRQILAVDLNHDNKMDLLIASQDGLHLLVGNGTSQPPILRRLLHTPVQQVATLDFNRDQKTDLLITSSVESKRTLAAIHYRRDVTLYLQQKDGSFSIAQTQELAGEVGFKILIGDLDQDGYPDAIITGYTVYHFLWNQAGQRWSHTQRTQHGAKPDARLIPQRKKQPREVLIPTEEPATRQQVIEIWRFSGREMSRRTAFREWGPWQRRLFDLDGNGRSDFAQFRTGSVRVWLHAPDGHFQKSYRFFMDVVREVGTIKVSAQGVLSFAFLDNNGSPQHLSVLLPAAYKTAPKGHLPKTHNAYQVVQHGVVAEKIRNTLQRRHDDLHKQSFEIYRYDPAQRKHASSLFPLYREHYGVLLQGRQHAEYRFTLQGDLWPLYARFSPIAPNDSAFRGPVSANKAATLAALVAPVFSEKLSPTWRKRIDIHHFFAWKNETQIKDRHHTFYVSKQSYSDGLDWKYWITHVTRPTNISDPFLFIHDTQTRNKIKSTLRRYGFSTKDLLQMDVMYTRFGSFMQSQVERPTSYPPLSMRAEYCIAYQGKVYCFRLDGTSLQKI